MNFSSVTRMSSAVVFGIFLFSITYAGDAPFSLDDASLNKLDQTLNSIDENDFKVVETTETKSPKLNSYQDFLKFYETILKDGEFVNFKAFNPDGSSAIENGRFKNDKEFMSFVKNKPQTVSAQPWTFAKYPDFYVRKLGYEFLMNNKESASYFFDENSLKLLVGKENRVNFLKNPTSIFNTRTQEPLPESNDNTVVSALDSKIKDSSVIKWIACLRLSPFAANKCSQSLDYILELMKPSGKLTAVPVIRKIIEDPMYAEGASRAALKIMSKVDASGSGRTQFGDLFADIYQSYVEAGIPPKNAEEMSWDLLAVYSARGANINMLFPYASGKAGSKTLIALESIAIGASVLDAATHQSGYLYSIPKQISTVANYGKPYHFWMSAYIARESAKRFHSESAAQTAAALSELGYQMFSVTNGRHELFQSILSTGQFGVEAYKTKIDLAFGFAGASYGAKIGIGKTDEFRIDIDYTVKEMIENASNLKPWTVEKSKQMLKSPIKKFLAYFKWMKIIKPIAGLNSIKSQIGCVSFLHPKIKTPFGLRGL